MAWESASFPWDWDADALLIEDHESCTNSKKPGGSSMRPHVAEPHAVRNGKPSLTSRDDVRKACSMSSVRLVDWEGPGQIHGEVGSAMPSTCRVFPSGASFGQGIKSGVVPEKSSILTGCIGNGFFGQQGVQYTWKRAGHRVAGLMEPGNQEQTNMVQPEHHKANFLTQKIEGFGSEVQVDDDAMEGIKAAYTDEHHSSNATGSAGSGDSLTGLQLGKRTYSLDLTRISKKTAQKSNMAACKKARTTVAVVPRCQVEGCKLDLTSAKDYYRRHKVCEPHSKFEKVVVASMEQRFCQQCSRFHLLSEFDEAKRSCRRRLAGHNERRRKPQLDTLALQAGLRSSYEDWSYLHQPRFSRMSLLWQGSSGFRSDVIWPCTTTAVEDRPAHNYAMQGLAMGILDHTKGLHQSSIINDDKLSLLLQSPKTVMPQDVHHPHVQQWPLGPLGGPIGDTLTLATASAGGVLPGLDVTTPVNCTVTRVSDSGRALSLLSLQPQGSQAPGIVKLEPPGLAELTTLDHHQPVHDEEVLHQPFPLQAGQQHHSDFHVEKMMGSMDTLYFQPQSTGGAIEKTVDCSYAPDLNRQASSYPLFTLMPYHQEGLTGGRPAQ